MTKCFLIVQVALFSFSLLVSPALLSEQSTSRQSKSGSVDRELEQRRATALSLLQSLAVEARSYRDESLRARVQARIADVIWVEDHQTARTLFYSAWTLAETVEEGTTESNPGRRSANRPNPKTNLRREILNLVSRRDKALAEELLRRLTAKDPNNSKPEGTELSIAESAERLRLAGPLVEMNEMQRALQFADPALKRVNERAIRFLVYLRNKDTAAADQRFAFLLSSAASDAGSDANTVSLLTSYAFTPWIYLVVSRTGIPSSNSYLSQSAPQLSPNLRKHFFDVAAGILLRPLTQIDQSSAGRAGTHFITMRLLPLFAQHAREFVPALNAQLASMGPAAVGAHADPMSLNRGMNGGGRPEIEDELNDRLDRARNSEGRDRAYAFAAMDAAERADARAHSFADKIEDPDTRKGVKSFVDHSMTASLIREKKADEALSLIRKSDLPRVLRAYFLTQVAALTLKQDRVRGAELFTEALTETRRLDANSSDRAYCLVALLREYSTFDRTRTWELLSEMIKTANSVADFTGEEGGNTSVTLEGKFSIRMTRQLALPTDLTVVFGRLAEESFYQALDVSKTFSGEAPRALAMIAVARALLDAQPSNSRR